MWSFLHNSLVPVQQSTCTNYINISIGWLVWRTLIFWKPQSFFQIDILCWFGPFSACITAQPVPAEWVHSYSIDHQEPARQRVYSFFLLFVLVQQFKSTSHFIYWRCQSVLLICIPCVGPCWVIFKMASIYLSGKFIHSYWARSHVLWRQLHILTKMISSGTKHDLQEQN